MKLPKLLKLLLFCAQMCLLVEWCVTALLHIVIDNINNDYRAAVTAVQVVLLLLWIWWIFVLITLTAWYCLIFVSLCLNLFLCLSHSVSTWVCLFHVPLWTNNSPIWYVRIIAEMSIEGYCLWYWLSHVTNLGWVGHSLQS